MQSLPTIKNELGKVMIPSDTIENIYYPFGNITNLSGDTGSYENELYFYHGDHLSSTQMITDKNASIKQQVLYAPFGEVITEYNAYWNNDDKMPDYLFNAKIWDEENEMFYYEARYYNPPSFISRDPLFEEYPTLSPYAYCNLNPILYSDPTGMAGKISIYCAGTNSARTSKDEGQFRYEANREVTWGLTTNSYSGRTTTSFLQTLRNVTATEGEIEYLSIYSHSGSMHLFLDNGQYGKEAITNKNLNSTWNKLGLTDLINDADIKFSSNALVVFAGCYAGKTENSEGQSIYSIAKDFTTQSGVASIGATNSTYPSSKDNVRTVDRGQYSLFYKDANGDVQQMPLGNKLNKETLQKAKDFIDGLNQ
jgi:RHS repeat-associated protein